MFGSEILFMDICITKKENLFNENAVITQSL
jgi:hypothetical protein